MALLRNHEVPEYRAEFATLVVRGSPVELLGELSHLDPDLLEEFAFAGWVHDVGLGGNGWFTGLVSDTVRVLVEAHDAPPETDNDRWDDVTETPFLTAGRSVRLTEVLSDEPVGGRIELGRPGLYRIRMSYVRSGDENPFCRLQFWPVDGVPEPPRHLRRGQAVADRDLVMDLVGLARWSIGGTTMSDLTKRLLATPAEIGEAFREGMERSLLDVEGDPAGGADTRIALTAIRPRDPDEPEDPAIVSRRGLEEIRAWFDQNGHGVNVPAPARERVEDGTTDASAWQPGDGAVPLFRLEGRGGPIDPDDVPGSGSALSP